MQFIRQTRTADLISSKYDEFEKNWLGKET